MLISYEDDGRARSFAMLFDDGDVHYQAGASSAYRLGLTTPYAPVRASAVNLYSSKVMAECFARWMRSWEFQFLNVTSPVYASLGCAEYNLRRSLTPSNQDTLRICLVCVPCVEGIDEAPATVRIPASDGHVVLSLFHHFYFFFLNDGRDLRFLGGIDNDGASAYDVTKDANGKYRELTVERLSDFVDCLAELIG
jgi:hypothetical protein